MIAVPLNTKFLKISFKANRILIPGSAMSIKIYNSSIIDSWSNNPFTLYQPKKINSKSDLLVLMPSNLEVQDKPVDNLTFLKRHSRITILWQRTRLQVSEKVKFGILRRASSGMKERENIFMRKMADKDIPERMW